jgi:hypothetical protein
MIREECAGGGDEEISEGVVGGEVRVLRLGVFQC